ncbi:MAG: AraC family transcriptional regulator [Candidatus Methylacidiphilales bacterium]|nr:AraC family transcriptional regulator [Candidatus Methylacidiphilales bacterium]
MPLTKQPRTTSTPAFPRRGLRVAPPFDSTRFLLSLEPCRHIEELVGLLPDSNYFAKDSRGRFVLMDDGFVAMLGCTGREQVIGRTDYDFFPKETARQYVADDRRVMASGMALRRHPEPVPDRDLTFHWWLVNKVPLRDRKGMVVGVAGLMSRMQSEPDTSLYGDSMLPVLSHIGRTYGQPVKVPELARLAGLSVRSFERHFQKMFQTSPIRYVNLVRLQAARQRLIRSALSLAEIASSCGFYDQSHMTALFTRHFGLSPRRYRLAHDFSQPRQSLPPPSR